MAVLAVLFFILIGLGVAATIGAIIYLIIRRIDGDREPFKRRTN